jgi:hypothetical protein
MATEAEAAREARAKVIAAEGEMQASHSLKEASDVISTSPAALQVRASYLVTKNLTLVTSNPLIIVINANSFDASRLCLHCFCFIYIFSSRSAKSANHSVFCVTSLR